MLQEEEDKLKRKEGERKEWKKKRKYYGKGGIEEIREHRRRLKAQADNSLMRHQEGPFEICAIS